MGEEHLYLLPKPHRYGILFGLCDIAGNLAGVFVFFSSDLARICFRAALHLRWAGLAGVFQGLVFSDAFASRFPVRIGIVAAELLERFALRSDVLVVLGVPFKVGAEPCAVGSACFVQHRNVGFDVAINQPS